MLTRWLLVVTSLAAASLAAPGSLAEEELDWWQSEVFYQIYPRSFKDSDGDGTGDLKGIMSKLEHFNDLGVGAVWLSPIFVSPMADFGYDIADFYNIDPIFGTMADFDALIARAKELGIKIILDLVPNHSSDECEWFIKSKSKDPVYADWYIWMDPVGTDPESGKPVPPNQWIGAFNEPVWTFVEERQQFYYHRYNFKQPDLNFRNPAVRQEMEKVIRFWLDKGAMGYRVDSIITLVEKDFPNVTNDHNDEYTINQPMTYEVVQEWRQVLDEYKQKDGVTRVMMTEAYGELKDTNGYYGNATHRGAHFTFNFNFISNLTKASKAQDVVETIDAWMDDMPSFATANWVIGNHDNHRVASRFGNELAAGMGMLSLLLPGIGVIYNGEEIGMMNNWNISYEQTLDPSGINVGPDRYKDFSRDFERTPFHWDDSKDAGFSSSDKTWLPVHANYKDLNLALQKKQTRSYWHIYRNLFELRKKEAILKGDYVAKSASENVVAVLRTLNGESYMVFINLGDDIEKIDVNAVFGPSLPNLYVHTSSIMSSHDVGTTVSPDELVLRPKSSVVLTNQWVEGSSGAKSHSLTLTLAALIAASKLVCL